MMRSNLVACADRHGRFVDDDRKALQRFRDGLGGGVDVRQVRVAVASARRRAYANENRSGAPHRRRQIVVKNSRS